MTAITRLPTFEANIIEPVNRAIEDNRSIEDIAGIIEEIELFACPRCGHITPDHRWYSPFNCLAPECPCIVRLQYDDFDEFELVEEISRIIRGRSA